jgi:hypothetical protein
LVQALADSTVGQTETYLQSLGGLRTQLRFPGLSAYAGTPYRALAKAELVIKVPPGAPVELPPPPQITALVNDTTEIAVPGLTGGLYDADGRGIPPEHHLLGAGRHQRHVANNGLIPGSVQQQDHRQPYAPGRPRFTGSAHEAGAYFHHLLNKHVRHRRIRGSQ